MEHKHLIEKVDQLLNELSAASAPKWSQAGPVSATLDILQFTELTPIQRMILIYMVIGAKEFYTQKEIWWTLGISNKAARQNLENLMWKGYVGRGPRASQWFVTK